MATVIPSQVDAKVAAGQADLEETTASRTGAASVTVSGAELTGRPGQRDQGVRS